MQGEDFSAATWHKSSYSGCETANCVEVTATATRVAVRDSKDPHIAMLVFSRAQWRAFIADITQASVTER